ncbi:MAG: MBL fold metallo-hydrolase [Patescibacteria group bacterium]
MLIREQTLIKLSKKLRRLKREAAEKIKREAIYPSHQRKIVFPCFHYSKSNLYARTAPWKYIGFVIYLDKLVMVVDPGAEFETRTFASGINPLEANTLFISHSHLDHYAGANVALENMLYPGNPKIVTLIAPKEVFKEKAVSDYFSNISGKGIKNVRSIVSKSLIPIEVNGATLTPIPMFHSIKGTQGFVLNYQNLKIGYITDTGYTKVFQTKTGQIVKSGTDDYEGIFSRILKKHDYLKKTYRDVDILICNVNDFIFTKHSKFHLTGYDVIDILKDSKVKKCFISHLGLLDLTDNAFSNAYEKYVTETTGIETIALKPEGITFNFPQSLFKRI